MKIWFVSYVIFADHIYWLSIPVCVGVIDKLSNLLEPEEKTNMDAIEAKFRDFCENTAKKQDHRFCYYVGGLEESATKIVGELSKPMSWGMPPLKICEKLMKKDAQICDLRYGGYFC